MSPDNGSIPAASTNKINELEDLSHNSLPMNSTGNPGCDEVTIPVNRAEYIALLTERDDLQSTLYRLVKHLQRSGQWDAARTALDALGATVESSAEIAERVVAEIDSA